MNILLAGGSGYIGRELGIRLTELGHNITVLTRNKELHKGTLPYPCDTYLLGRKRSFFDKNYDGIINLCGESVSRSRWNSSFKKS